MIHIENYFWIFLMLPIAAVVSYIYVQRQLVGSLPLKWILISIRFLSLFFLLVLLLSPILKCNKTKSLKPKIALLYDNSKSIKKGTSSSMEADIIKLKSIIKDKGKYDIEEYIFDKDVKPIDSLNLKGNRTDIFHAISTTMSSLNDENLQRVILVTDGNYNVGNNPLYAQNNKLIPIDVILVGDTAKLADLKIENLEYNKLILQDEQNSVSLIVTALSASNTKATVILEELTVSGARPIDKIQFPINSNQSNRTIQFRLPQLSKGKHYLRVSILSDAKEANIKNNQKEFTIEVIDGTKQIDIISNFPHPDISALKSWLESNKSFKVKISVAGNISNFSENSDLVIFYQIPNALNNGQALFEKAKASGKSVLFMLGSQSDYNMFNQMQDCYQVQLMGQIEQDYGAKMNPNFSKFYLKEAPTTSINTYPPLSNYLIKISAKKESNTLLWARMGRVDTDQPLIAFSMQDNVQIGLLAAENIWKWRVYNFQSKKNVAETQDLIDKIVDYLAIKKDKKQIQVQLSDDEINEGDNFYISVNTYNELYQPKRANNVQCIIQGNNMKSQKFDMIPMENTYTLSPKGLAAGQYSYAISANMDGKIFNETGSFRIHRDDIEDVMLPANYDDMYSLAEKSNGNLWLWNERMNYKLDQGLSSHFSEKLVNETLRLKANDLWMLLLAILLLLSIEWLIRKYFGLH